MKVKRTDTRYYSDMNMIRFGPKKGFNSIVHQAVGNGIYNRTPGCFLKNMISNYAV